MGTLQTTVKVVRAGVRRAVARARRRGVIADFHSLYYYDDTWRNTYWMGRRILKCPLDLWQYQDIIYRQRPDLVIETGTADGGSALFLAHLLDLVDHGKLITVDINHVHEQLPRHDRITYLTGSSVSPEVLDTLKREVGDAETVLVILDSDHSASHVRAELDAYQHFVSPGSYLIVEDGNVNGHPVGPRFGPGPMEAIKPFLNTNPPFTVDTSCERYLMTQNPSGYLLRDRHPGIG